MDNLEIIKRKFDQIKGEFVICDEKVVRLVGIAEDDEDYYYVLYDGKKITLVSILIGIIVLKGNIGRKEYKDLIRSAILNHDDLVLLYDEYVTPNKAFENYEEMLSKISNIGINTRFIGEPYFTLK